MDEFDFFKISVLLVWLILILRIINIVDEFDYI